MAGRKSDLQIKAAGETVHVQHLSGKVKAFRLSGLHGFGIHLPNIHAAPGNDRFIEPPSGLQPDGQRLKRSQQRFALLARKVMDG